MDTQPSLNGFFERVTEEALSACDAEQIHLSGRLQAHGAMLGLDPATGAIRLASANIERFLGHAPSEIAGRPLREVAPDLADQLDETPCDETIFHEILDCCVWVGDEAHDAVTHLHGGMRMIEFVPNRMPSAGIVRKKMREAGKACAQIMNAASFDEALVIAAQAARRVTGFARVKIYRFLPDWSGEVLAEDRDPAMPSYLGLHFPAGDIPAQVREIMTIVPYRSIGSTGTDTVPILCFDGAPESADLTWSVNRSVSEMHLAYLNNMGIRATFSCSLMDRGRLWGLIAAHNDVPGMVPFDCWSLLHEIGSALMLRHEQQERAQTADKIAELRRIESHFAAALREKGDVEEVIRTLVPVLQRIMNADGFAFIYGTNLHVSGRTPPREMIPKMIHWALQHTDAQDQYRTTHLHRDWPPARAHIETACGVLIQPIATHRVCQLIWFRGPITRTVEWAGRPEKTPAGGAGGTALGPRRSFDRWVEQHRDQSRPWQISELESAKEIFKEFLDIIASQLLLKEENMTLQKFAASAAHDLRAPLQSISAALEFMAEDAFEQSSVKQLHAIADSQAKRLMTLTEGLLELAVVKQQQHNTETCDLAEIVEEVRQLLAFQIAEAGGRVEIGWLPPITANRRLMCRLFQNLVSNALKYRRKDRPVHVEIAAVALPHGGLEISVSDNGMGIAPKDAEKVLQPMERLHSHDEIEGTGLGLAICATIMAQHGGSIRVDKSRQEGARLVLTLPAMAQIAA